MTPKQFNSGDDDDDDDAEDDLQQKTGGKKKRETIDRLLHYRLHFHMKRQSLSIHSYCSSLKSGWRTNIFEKNYCPVYLPVQPKIHPRYQSLPCIKNAFYEYEDGSLTTFHWNTNTKIFQAALKFFTSLPENLSTLRGVNILSSKLNFRTRQPSSQF